MIGKIFRILTRLKNPNMKGSMHKIIYTIYAISIGALLGAILALSVIFIGASLIYYYAHYFFE